MKRIKIAIVGCGKQAPKHISGLLKCSNVDIVLVDQFEEAARKLAAQYDVEYVSTVDDVFQDEEIAGISICTPTPTHYEIICKAIASNKHFLCEKPLVEENWQADSVQQRLGDSNLIGAVGYIYRQAPVFQKVKQILEHDASSFENSVIGEVHTAFFRIGGRGSHAIWKHRTESGGGAINEMLVHQLDLANWFFGDIEEYELIERSLKQSERMINGTTYTADAEDLIILKAKYVNGTEAFFWADMLTPSFAQSTELMGASGNLAASIINSFDSFVFAAESNKLYPAGRSELKFPQVNLFESQMNEFITAIRTGVGDNLPTVVESLKIQRFIYKLR